MTTEELGEQRAKELGLKTHPDPEPSYYADDIHKLLGEGVEVENPSDDKDTACQRWSLSEYSIKGYGKQQGLLIGIRPINPPSRVESEIKAKIDQINKLSKEIEALLERKP